MTAHNCVAETNALLAQRNTRLADVIDISGQERELIALETVKADDKVRGRPISMFASFCPFCGVKLNLGGVA